MEGSVRDSVSSDCLNICQVALKIVKDRWHEKLSRPVFINGRAAARYRALASIIPGREGFSWNLSFLFS